LNYNGFERLIVFALLTTCRRMLAMAQRLTLITALTFLLMLVTSGVAGQNDRDRDRNDEAERRQLENLRREVRDLERTVKQVESDIESRKKQLAEAPKTINPAEKELKESEKRHDKATEVIVGLKKRADEAQANELKVLRSLKSQFDGADKMDEAEAKLEAAEKRLEAAKVAGVEKLSKDASYKAAQDRVFTAKIRMEVLNEQREEGRVSSANIADAGALLFQFQRELDAMEAKVLTSDERYKQALKDVEEARTTVEQLRSQMVEKVKTHPEYEKASKDLLAAREAFGEATREVTQASKSKAEATGNLSKLKAQVKEFERDTERLQSRQQALQSQLRAKEKRADDYERSIRR